MSAVPANATLPDAISHLALLKKGDCATISGLATDLDTERSTLRLRLIELGFVPGEKVRVVAESFPQGDPMAVRVGTTTFALRRHEAALVHIVRETPGTPAR